MTEDHLLSKEEYDLVAFDCKKGVGMTWWNRGGYWEGPYVRHADIPALKTVAGDAS